MIQGKNRRLANVKTRRETGLDYVMFSLDLNTPFGKKQLKEVRPYYPGEEAELRDELDRVEQMIAFVKQNQILTDKIQEVFMEVKDATLTIERSGAVTLSTVELFEIKSLLLQMRLSLQKKSFLWIRRQVLSTAAGRWSLQSNGCIQ